MGKKELYVPISQHLGIGRYNKVKKLHDLLSAETADNFTGTEAFQQMVIDLKGFPSGLK